MPEEREFNPDPQSYKEAAKCVAAGIIYFALKKPIITALVFIVMLGSCGYVLHDYLTSDTIKIEKLSPLKSIAQPSSFLFSFSNIAYASDKGYIDKCDSLIIDKIFIGCKDTNWKIYKLRYSPIVIFHNSKEQTSFQIEMPVLNNEERIMQYKKGK